MAETPPVRPAVQSSQRLPSVTANLHFSAGGIDIAAPMTVPAVPAPAEAVLPALQMLVNRVVEAAETRQRAAGAETTCRRGCAACCRHLVPLSRTEARGLAALVAAQSPQRRDALRARFAAAAARLRAGALVADWFDMQARVRVQDRTLSTGYFAAYIDCPFLDNEACSIYADRPLACRELKVTSPPEQCSTPEQDGVIPLPLPKFSVAVRGLEEEDDKADTTGQWLPLPLALEWMERDAARPRQARSGPQWIQRFLGRLGKGR